MTIVPKVITPPAFEPITWADVQAQSRISDAEEQGYAEGLIKTVRQHLERRTGRAFCEQTLEVALDYWPFSTTYAAQSTPGYIGFSSYGIIELPRATPLQSIVSIKYKMSDGVELTIDPTDYCIDSDALPGRIAPAYNTFWPSFTPYPLSPIHIRYVAGYSAGSPAVPYPDEDIKHAMRLLVGHFYDHREAVVIGENVTIESKQMELAMAALLLPLEIQAF
jgi:hypothetical protein